MNVSCPQCQTTYRVDPRKVPAGGVRARCAECGNVFPVHASAGAAAPVDVAPAPAAAVAQPTAETASAPAPPPPPAAPPPPAPVSAPPEPVADTRPEPEAEVPAAAPSGRPGAPSFGLADPHAKARRLARALVSDIVVYHPERRERSLADGTLRQEFREEIQKSWEEYTDQVGSEFARETPYFREALNEILANGSRLF